MPRLEHLTEKKGIDAIRHAHGALVKWRKNNPLREFTPDRHARKLLAKVKRLGIPRDVFINNAIREWAATGKASNEK